MYSFYRGKKDPAISGDATPEVHRHAHHFYGTYNIQPTTNTDNTFPLIGPALPTAWKNMVLEKEDLEREG